jgi:putative FmdB family regulatory protein
VVSAEETATGAVVGDPVCEAMIMPIYEYDCPECGKFETIQKFSDEPLVECPTCRGAGRSSAVKRLVSLASFHLKGGGWYKTDYGSSGGTSGGASSGGSEAASSGSSGSGGEAGGKSDGGSSGGEKVGGCGSACACH